MAKQNKYTINSENTLWIEKKEGCYPIRISHWNKLKLMVDSLKEIMPLLSVLWPLCAGAFLSAAISLIGIFNSENDVKDWYLIVMICTTVISGVLAIVFFFLNKESSTIKTEQGKNIKTEMEYIEGLFEAPVIDAETQAPNRTFVTIL